MRQLGRHRISKQSFGFERNARLDRSMPHRRSSDVANAVWLISEVASLPGVSILLPSRKKFVSAAGHEKKAKRVQPGPAIFETQPPPVPPPHLPFSASFFPRFSPTGGFAGLSPKLERGRTRINLPLPFYSSLPPPGHDITLHITSPMRHDQAFPLCALTREKRRLPRVKLRLVRILDHCSGSFDVEVASRYAAWWSLSRLFLLSFLSLSPVLFWRHDIASDARPIARLHAFPPFLSPQLIAGQLTCSPLLHLTPLKDEEVT